MWSITETKICISKDTPDNAHVGFDGSVLGCDKDWRLHPACLLSEGEAVLANADCCRTVFYSTRSPRLRAHRPSSRHAPSSSSFMIFYLCISFSREFFLVVFYRHHHHLLLLLCINFGSPIRFGFPSPSTYPLNLLLDSSCRFLVLS